LLSMVVALTVGCLGSDFADSVEGSWQLVSGSVDGADIVLVDSHPITITFDGDQVGGTASCNGYGGTFQLSGSSIELSDLAMTEMACFPEETMDAEAAYAAALGKVTTVAVDQTLTLSGPGAHLEFEPLAPVPQAELTNTVWVLDGLVSGDSVSSVTGDRATLEFFTDGSVLGGTGCRTFAGHYTVAGEEVQMTDLSASGEPCTDQLADQDSHVISSLEGGFRVEIEANRLTTWSAGDEGLTYLADS
jgi:heat shock protein HslJ